MQDIGLALVGAALVAALIFLLARPFAHWMGHWGRSGRSPTGAPPPTRAPPFGDAGPVQPDAETAKRIADLRWRAACQILFQFGALKAPGLLREFVEHESDPVRTVEAVMRLLGCEPQRVNARPAAGGYNVDREEFVDRLDAFCVLEEEISGPDVAEDYRHSVLERLRAGDVAHANDLGLAFTAVREALAHVLAAHEYEAEDFEILPLRDLDATLKAFARSLRSAPPADALRARLDAEELRSQAASYFILAREAKDQLARWEPVRDDIDASDTGDPWCKAKRAELGGILAELDAHAEVIYATDADLPTMLASLEGVRRTIERLARLRDEFVTHFRDAGGSTSGGSRGAGGSGKSRYGGGGGAGPSDEFSEENVRNFFGLKPGQILDQIQLKALCRKLRIKHYPDRYPENSADWRRENAYSKRIAEMESWAERYFVDIRV